MTLEEEATVWWIVLFTCVFQTLHKVLARAMDRLLKLLEVVICFLGKFPDTIKRIASHLPNTNYLRAKYLQEQIVQADTNYSVVWPKCHRLHNIDKNWKIRMLFLCVIAVQFHLWSESWPLPSLIHPHLLFPWCSVISLLHVLIKRPGLLRLCNEWKLSHSQSCMLDVYDGRVWTTFSDDAGSPFLNK